MRVGVGGIWHETNTFVPRRTEIRDFHAYEYTEGEALIERHRLTGSELGGAIRAAIAKGVEIVPLAYAAAVPSGTVAKEAFEELAGRIVNLADAAERLDGVVLALHGSMVVEEQSDPEAELVAAIRGVVGDCPIGVTLDLHANPSPRLAEVADLLVGYDTFPHVDMADRGEEALGLVVRMIRGRIRPERCLVKLPLLTVPQMQETMAEPMRSIMEAVHRFKATDRVWTVSALPGYPYADVDRLGFSVYVAGERDCAPLANKLAALVWEQRTSFKPELLEPEEAVRLAAELGGPTVLVDVADNVGGGSPGDGTVLLALLERLAVGDAVIVIWDPYAIERIYAADQDTMSISVGGRATADLGGPVSISGPVRRLGQVVYRRSGPYMRGQLVAMGRVAVVESRAGAVVITERRVMPFDDDHLRVIGIEPEKRRVIVAKSAIAWKAAFGSYAKQGLYARTPGYCPSDLSSLRYTQRPCPAYPLEEDARWPRIL